MRTKGRTKALIAMVMSSGLVAASMTAASPDLYHDTNNPSTITNVVTGSVTTPLGHTDLYHDT